VTGASSGIGLELAKEFARNGFDLLIATEDRGIHAAAAEVGALGAGVKPVQVDPSTFDGVEDVVQRLKSLNRPVEAAVINAGIGDGGGFANTDLLAELKLIVNVGPDRASDQTPFAGHDRKARQPDIDYGIHRSEAPGPLEAMYAASKAFDLSFAQPIRKELEDTGIT
jgi:short-subunit dehydrogenase